MGISSHLTETCTPDPLVVVVAKAALDSNFRKALAEDPEKAAISIGINLTLDQIKTIKGFKPEEWGAVTLKELDARMSFVVGRNAALWFCPVPPKD